MVCAFPATKLRLFSLNYLYHCFSYRTILKRTRFLKNFYHLCAGGNCGQVFLPVWVLSLEQECGIEQRQALPPTQYHRGGEEGGLRSLRPHPAAGPLLPPVHPEGTARSQPLKGSREPEHWDRMGPRVHGVGSVCVLFYPC